MPCEYETGDAFRVETPDGFVIVDSIVKMKPGDEVAFQYDGYPMVGKLFASGLITQDGETIDGKGCRASSSWIKLLRPADHLSGK